MKGLLDRRSIDAQDFDDSPWLFEQTIPSADATAWMEHLHAETESRDWSATGKTHCESRSNHGSHSVHTESGQNARTLHIVWKRPRNGDLHVKAIPDKNFGIPADIAQGFMDAVSERYRSNTMSIDHRYNMLSYEGPAWRGELWLGDDIRLGPPSRFPPSPRGPQIVIVDAMVEGIGSLGIDRSFEKLVCVLRVFLASVLGIRTEVVKRFLDWVTEFDEKMRPINCEVKYVGYSEVGSARSFPAKNAIPPMPREVVERPGIGRSGLSSDQREQWVPEDVEHLWQTLGSLSVEKKDDFLRAGNALLNAGALWPDQRTTYAVFHVIACEALKPRGKQYDDLNVYDIVASLIGIPQAEKLRTLAVPPQSVRNRHLHRGEVMADEFSSMLLYDSFNDPSFDQMLHELSRVCQACLVEWLRRMGEYEVIRLPRL
jgi:hypothetical protein